jgi:2-dehydro-3-deoxyphosphooctonate aldolase (KDO 8-P synthase)
MAASLVRTLEPFSKSFVFKCSFDKANRSRSVSYRGASMTESLKVFDEVRTTFGVPVITDVHEPWQCKEVAHYVDVLQIPAFLCRQTDLLSAAGETGLPVNVKKGQFLSPADMRWAVEKVRDAGGQPMACERGTTFGHNDLINDFRGIRVMGAEGTPVVFDATHSVQQPGSGTGSTKGDRSSVHDLARAAVGVGVAGLFMEVHDNPDQAPSDGPNMIALPDLAWRLDELLELDELTKRHMAARRPSALPEQE